MNQQVAAPPVVGKPRTTHRASTRADDLVRTAQVHPQPPVARTASVPPRSFESYHREACALQQAAMLAEFNGTYDVASQYRAAAARLLQAARDAEKPKS